MTAREIEVGVLGNAAPAGRRCPARSCPTHEFYDYDDKYLDGAAELVIPADLPAEVAEEVAAPGRRRRSGRCAATAWPGSTSSTRRTAAACC